MTIGERKIMGSMQRREGRNIVGYKGILQAIADGEKLIIKEMIERIGSERIGLYIGPIIIFIISLYPYMLIEYSRGIVIKESNIGIIIILGIMGIGIYGVIIGGWSGNSKYGYMGGIRSTAQMISYEIGLGIIIIGIIMCNGSLDIQEIINSQRRIWNIIGLLGIGIIVMIIGLAETNRAPFDLPEAESELTAGFMTEHSGAKFAYYFLGEYSSIIFMSIMFSILLLGGPGTTKYIILNGIILGIKVSLILIVFIWVRASYPRMRYDQLIKLMWKKILPLILGIIVIIPSIIIK